jgi:hypothetical protein
VRFPYKTYPTPRGSDWWAVLPVQIANTAKHSPPTKRFEALIDSGASNCIFHTSVGRAIGLDIENGEKQETTGISGVPTIMHVHHVSLYVCGHILKIRAGFTDQLPLAGILGRTGFFEHFKVLFDPSSNPPGVDIERVYKA